MSGVTLPSNRPDQTVEESEDEGIKVLVESCLKNLKFDGYPVTNVHVPSKSSIVKICQEDHKNDFIPQEETLIIQKIMTDSKMDKKKAERKSPRYLQQTSDHPQTC